MLATQTSSKFKAPVWKATLTTSWVIWIQIRWSQRSLKRICREKRELPLITNLIRTIIRTTIKPMCFKVLAEMQLGARKMAGWVETCLRAETLRIQINWVREGHFLRCTQLVCKSSKRSPVSLSTRLQPWSRDKVRKELLTTTKMQTTCLTSTLLSSSLICLWVVGRCQLQQARTFPQNHVHRPQMQTKISIIIKQHTQLIKILRFDPKIHHKFPRPSSRETYFWTWIAATTTYSCKWYSQIKINLTLTVRFNTWWMLLN